jgi:hypothetical protein
MPQYEVFLFKDASLDIPTRHDPAVDRIMYIEYDGDDGAMAVGDVREDETFALKIAARYWDDMMRKIYSDEYNATAEDLIFQVTNRALLETILEDGHPYKKILVKKTRS